MSWMYSYKKAELWLICHQFTTWARFRLTTSMQYRSNLLSICGGSWCKHLWTHRILKDVFCYTYSYLLPHRIYSYLLDFSMVKSKSHIKKEARKGWKVWQKFLNLCAKKNWASHKPTHFAFWRTSSDWQSN